MERSGALFAEQVSDWFQRLFRPSVSASCPASWTSLILVQHDSPRRSNEATGAWRTTLSTWKTIDQAAEIMRLPREDFVAAYWGGPIDEIEASGFSPPISVDELRRIERFLLACSRRGGELE